MKRILIFAGIIIFSIAAFLIVDEINKYTVGGNFKAYKEDREEMIRMLKTGEIKKERFYYTPERFKEANVNDILNAKMYGNRHFVFFQWVKSPVFGPGLIEGFLYTSTGKPPTIKEFDHLAGCKFEKVQGEDNWYFASNDDGYYD
ncbi:hypothetical protein ACJROX_27960 [Pseudalkalibacillus sp. A8]|uniref:hypothetical protein n=1 Tax=Pseudalkalibacillus sp. A8 TaxID=3382641 RepID=UPI0038B5850B